MWENLNLPIVIKKIQNNKRKEEVKLLKIEKLTREMEEHMIVTDIKPNVSTLQDLNLNIIKNNKYLIELDKFIVKSFINLRDLNGAILENIETYNEWSTRIEQFFTGKPISRNIEPPTMNNIIPLSELPRLDPTLNQSKKIENDIKNIISNNTLIISDIQILKKENMELRDKIEILESKNGMIEVENLQLKNKLINLENGINYLTSYINNLVIILGITNNNTQTNDKIK